MQQQTISQHTSQAVASQADWIQEMHDLAMVTELIAINAMTEAVAVDHVQSQELALVAGKIADFASRCREAAGHYLYTEPEPGASSAV